MGKKRDLRGGEAGKVVVGYIGVEILCQKFCDFFPGHPREKKKRFSRLLSVASGVCTLSRWGKRAREKGPQHGAKLISVRDSLCLIFQEHMNFPKLTRYQDSRLKTQNGDCQSCH
jgi:hypothetical protein